MNLHKISSLLTKNWTAKLICFAIAVIVALFYRMNSVDERYLRIPFKVVSNNNFITATDVPKNIKVSLRGNRDDIYTILSDDLNAYADFSDISEEGIYERAIKVERLGNALYMTPLEISVEPQKVSFLFEKKIIKRVRVEPILRGTPAEGYELASFFLTPDSITVEGPESLVKEINSFRTKPVSISGKSENFSVPVEIDNNNSHINVLNTDTYISIKIAGIRIIHNFSPVGIQLENCRENLNAVCSILSGSLKLETKNGENEAVTVSGLKLVADMSDISDPGVYQLQLIPSVPESFDVVSFSPETVEVTVTEVLSARENN